MCDEEIKKDIFIELYREHGLWSRHQESQRAVVVNLIITISAALIGLVIFDCQINKADTPATIFIVLLGTFGTLFSYKYYERFHFHDSRIEAYKNELDKLIPEISISEIESNADNNIKIKFKFLRKLGLFKFWIIFNLSILILGLILSYNAFTSCTSSKLSINKTESVVALKKETSKQNIIKKEQKNTGGKKKGEQ